MTTLTPTTLMRAQPIPPLLRRQPLSRWKSTTLTASAKQDTLTIEAGDGVTLKVDATAKKATLSETYIDSCVVSSLDDVPANLRNGGIVILKE